MCKTKWFLATLLVFIVSNTFSQNFNTRYNFGFETTLDGQSDNWQLVQDSYELKYDTIDNVEGKRSIAFRRGYLKTEFSLCLYQKILLPKPSNQITVSLFSKNLDHQYSWLKISGFNKSGKIVVSDSVSILSSTWKEFTAKITHKDIYLVSIEIRTKEQFKEKKKEVKLWVDGISVFCDGKNLLSFEAQANGYSKDGIEAIKSNRPLNEDLILPPNVLKEIGNKKIIGFGETAHHSLEIDKCKYNNIRRLITDYNCRLVLFEMAIDLVAQYNLYIHGYQIDSTYLRLFPGRNKIDTAYVKLSFFGEEHEKFINWLKNYNSLHDDKVNIMGIDLHSGVESSNQTPPNLNRYISSMKLRSNTVDSLVALINFGVLRRIPLKYAINKEEQLTNLMGRFNFMVLLQTLKSRTDSALLNPNFSNWSSWQSVHRDYVLWKNTKQVLDNFTDGKSPVVVCAHYGHLDKVSYIHLNEVVPLGQYLFKAYGNDYAHIGILLDQGKVIATKENKTEYVELQKPINGSLEYLCSQVNIESFYKSGFIKSKTPLLIRRLGQISLNFQFFPEYYPGSMDGFIYIKNSKPAFKL